MKKVSIILPIYNVENYLERCVETVLGQTYKNIEVILVDDGATDNSGVICDDLAKRDTRIRVIHKQNGGLSSARNTGYQAATGEYLMYIDSDDAIKEDLVERCVKSIEDTLSDVVIYGYEKVSEAGDVLEICKWGNKTYTRDEMKSYLFQAIIEMSYGYAWNKLYRKSVLDKSGILADGKVIDREDLVYNMELLSYWNKITYIDYAGYEYLQRGNSLLHNSNLARLEGIEYFVNRMHDIDVGKQETNSKVFNMNVLHYLADCIIKNVIWNDSLKSKEKKKIMKEIISTCPHIDKLYQDSDNSKHLQVLYKSIACGKMWYFYTYVRLGDLKRKIRG